MALISKDKIHLAFISGKNKYGITKKDMIDNLEGFPVGVAVRMMEEQEKQGNEPNITVFQKHRSADCNQGGFNWDDTKDGRDFWNTVIFLDNFSFRMFFDKYPEYENYNFKID